MKSLILLGDRLAIEPVEPVAEECNGVILPTSAEAFKRGKVLITSQVSNSIPVNSIILYTGGRELDYNLNGKLVKLISMFDIIAIENEQE